MILGTWLALNRFGLSNPARFLTTTKALAQIAAAAVLLLSPAVAHANGAVLPPASEAEPDTLDAEMAIAVTPFGTTRWTRLTVGGTQRVLWLVPARPGAALDWAPDGWLKALEDATSPRVAPPTASPPCNMPSATERIPAWSTTGAKKLPRAVVVHASESEARAHVAARGFALSAVVGTKIADVYARGYALVSVELDASGSSVISSPTLRISDDGGAIVPLALTGSARTAVRVTSLVIGEGPAALSGARELDADALKWGLSSSNYANARASTLVAGGGAVWLREAASHEVLFDGLAVPRDPPIEPLVTGYFREATGQAQPACVATARTAGAGTGSVGRACAAGALARVPGGTACAPDSGMIDPASFACGANVDDLALALAGTSPSRTFVTRFTGFVPQGGFGVDAAVASTSTSESPIVFAGGYEACPVAVTPPGGGFTPPPPEQSTDDRPSHYEHNGGGCSGSSTTVVYEDTGEEDTVADEGCGSTSTGTSTSTGDDGDNCSGDSSSSSSSGSDDSSGWDDDDDDDSSSSSDSCDCGKSTTGSSSSGSSSGWDDEDMSAAGPKSLKTGGDADAGTGTDAAGEHEHKGKKHPKKTSSAKKKRKSSPVSRYALLFVALVLPLRRRLGMKKL